MDNDVKTYLRIIPTTGPPWQWLLKSTGFTPLLATA